MVQIPQFKIRCSSIHEIMGGAFTSPTQKQLARIAELSNKEKITDKQREELAELIAKRDSKPLLQEGAKTHCKEWLKEQLYGRKVEVHSKYMDKGIECEQSAIERVRIAQGYAVLSKNTERKSNSYMEGECDAVTGDCIEEIKNSWSFMTFPLFDKTIPDKKYELQVQGYMELWDKPKAAVNYVLIDMPIELIDKEAYYAAKRYGLDEVPAELFDEIYALHTYDGLPDHLLHKRYEFDRNTDVSKAIEQQVLLCREYIVSLLNDMGIEYEIIHAA